MMDTGKMDIGEMVNGAGTGEAKKMDKGEMVMVTVVAILQ